MLVLLLWVVSSFPTASALGVMFAADSTVDAEDAVPGDGVCATPAGACTLRAALAEANARAGADEIALRAATYDFDGQLGSFVITDDVDIRGDSSTTTTVDALSFERIPLFRISLATVALRKLAVVASVNPDEAPIVNEGALTIRDAYVAGRNNRGTGVVLNRHVLVLQDATMEGAFGDVGGIGAISNLGSVTAERCAITGSSGGGTLVANGGDVSLTNCVVESGINGNAITNWGHLEAERTEITGFLNGRSEFCPAFVGGAVFNGGTAILTECSIAGYALCGGGGLANLGTAELVGSTISGASDYGAGAIHNAGTLAMRNTTVSTAYTNSIVGGIENLDDGTIEMRGCTVTANQGGQFSQLVGGIRGSNVAIGHTIIAGNLGSPADCSGTLVSLGHNLIGDTTDCTITGDTATDVLNADPRLGPLAGNGGPTFTHALLAGSPARDAGAPTGDAGVDACLPADQRGVARPQGGACDIGALEATSCGDGTLGPGEQCDDGNRRDGDCCSAACTAEPDGTACDDGDACTTGTACRAGTCAAGDRRDCGPCGTCAVDGSCIATPQAACRQPTKRVSGDLEMVRKGTPKLIWKWNHGEATSRDEFGDPRAGEGFAFCVFDESGSAPRVAFARATHSGQCGKKPCWRSDSKTTFTYKDRDPRSDGLDTVFLKSGKREQARIVVETKGPSVSLPPLPAALPLRVQLQSADGDCWESRFFASTTTKNDAVRFKAKAFTPDGKN